MSLSPNGILARLEELKKWQQAQQERFQMKLLPKTNATELDLLSPIPRVDDGDGANEGVAPIVYSDDDASKPTANRSFGAHAAVNGDTPKVIKKKPFLRKGTGLAKFRMTLDDIKPPKKQQTRSTAKKKQALRKCFSNKVALPAENRDAVVKPSMSINVNQVPKLANPKVNISFKPKGLWTNVNVNEMHGHKDLTTIEEEDTIINQINRIVSLNEQNTAVSEAAAATKKETSAYSLENDSLLLEIENFFKAQQQLRFAEKDATSKERMYEEPSIEINQSERELRVFEALEQKAAQSSFCSTSSSVHRLLDLQSTPRKRYASLSPNSTVNSDDVKDLEDTRINYEDENHWSTTEADDDSTDEAASTARERILIVVDAETMTDPVSSGTADGEDLLRSKMRVLEDEVRVFRSENSKLCKQKIETEKELRELRRQKKEQEEERLQMQRYLDEEKRKLAKEKMVFDKYVKELKNKPSKKEREEMALLRNDLAAAKEELKMKESRHGAAQARLRTQIKQLEKDKESLMAEMESLRTQNGRLMAQQKMTPRAVTDTRVIHEINKKLSKLTEEKSLSAKTSKSVSSIKSSSSGGKSSKSGKCDTKSTRRSSNCYSKQAIISDDDDEEEVELEDDDNSESDEENRGTSVNNDEMSVTTDNSMEKLPVVYARQIAYRSGAAQHQQQRTENDRNFINYADSCMTFQTTSATSVPSDTDMNPEKDYEKIFNAYNYERSSSATKLHDNSNSSNSNREKTERFLKDGSKEITYPNGNVKTVSPDGNLIKMVYYNGDVKETDLGTGIVDYLYAESKIRHVTYTDGTEMLNFPDGKVEKRYKDGSYEVATSDGFVRSVDADGCEEVTYPDGTKVSISQDGEKVVKLLNGQRIVHTKEHKRREYPDGTVNILYPDGLLETRYKNGRIRIKDANGRCLRDTHDNIS